MLDFLRSKFIELFYDSDQRYPKSFLKGYPFLLSLNPTGAVGHANTKINKRAVFCRTQGKYDLYLYPDELRTWFFLFAGLIGLFSFLITSSNASWNIGDLNVNGWSLKFFWPVVFLSGYACGFYFIYHLIRLPCLHNMISLLPHHLEEWMLGYVERIDITTDDIDILKRSRISADIRLRTMLTRNGKLSKKLRTQKRKRYIERLGLDHPQEWLLRIAISRFFEKPRSYTPSVTLRVLFYWGAPVWIGYLLLLLPLFCALFYRENSGISTGGLVLTLLIWAIISTFFALVQTKLIAPGISANPVMGEALDTFPLVFRNILASDVSSLDYKHFNKILSKWLVIINFAAFTLFVMLIKFSEKSVY